MATCAACTLINPPNATLCEACGALLSTNCSVCPEDGDFLVTARRLWDGLSDVCMEGDSGVGIAICAGHIAWFGLLENLPESLLSLPTLEHHADVDSTLMPGLIDCHVHIEFDPGHGLHSQPRLDATTHMAAMQARAKRMLAHGITTARDLGGHGRAIELRNAIASGHCAGPRLLCAGQPITVPRGHCHQWGGEADGEEAIRRVAQRQLQPPTSCDVVKIMATGGVRTAGTNPAEAAFTLAQVSACVQEAAAAGRPCAAHAHGVRGIANAAEAGVSTIEHCSWVNTHGSWGHDEASVIDLIASKGIYVCPTIGAGWAQIPSLQNALAPALQRMRNAGVQLIAGSDAGAIPNLLHHRLADGLMVMARCAGQSHAEALRSATSEAAAALGVSAVCGRLEEGLSADLIVVRGDPVIDLEALCSPLLAVVCRGEVHQPCGRDAPGRTSATKPAAWTFGWPKGGAQEGHGGGLGSSARCACVR